MAAIAAPIIGGITSLIGGIFGSNAAQKAAAQQAAAAQAAAAKAGEAGAGAQAAVGNALPIANGYLQNGWEQAQENLSPYLQAGGYGIGALADATRPGGSLDQQFSYDPADVTQDPAYQFELGQGSDAIKRQMSATGQSLSAGELAALEQYGVGTASKYENQDYQQAFNTFQANRNNIFQQLSTLAGFGQTATGQANQAAQFTTGQQSQNTLQGAEYSGNAGLQAAQIEGQDITGAGNAQAAGTIGGANAWSTAMGGVGNAVQGYANNVLLGKLLASGNTYLPPNVDPTKG